MAKKPVKPSPDFPLFAHASGQWAKKIRGKTHYFGRWSDPEAARQQYLKVRDDLHAGRKPRHGEGTTVLQACNAITHAKKLQLESGDYSPRTLFELQRVCKRMLAFFGKETLVESLRAADFERYRAELAAQYGPARITDGVTKVRQVFKYAFDTELIDRMPRFGPLFRGATLKSKRLLRSQQPPRMWEAKELAAIIDDSGWHFRPVLLLAINCGFGQTDIATIAPSAFDLDSGWVRFPRPKTGVQRTCPLWPETVAAVRDYMKRRPPRDGRVFSTQTGRPLVQYNLETGSAKDAVSQQLTAILKRLDIVRPRVGFYGIRHTFQTVADDCRDSVAVRHIMGHADEAGDMSAAYREKIDPARLVAVTNHVRNWLWP